MLQLILGAIRCISDYQKPCVSITAGGIRVKDTSISLCYPVFCGHCVPSCQAESQAPGLLVSHYFFFFFFCLTWHPTGAKSVKRYFSYKFSAESFQTFSELSFQWSWHKTTFRIFEILTIFVSFSLKWKHPAERQGMWTSVLF